MSVLAEMAAAAREVERRAPDVLAQFDTVFSRPAQPALPKPEKGVSNED